VSNNDVNYKVALSIINKNREIYNPATSNIRYDNYLYKKSECEAPNTPSTLKATYIKNPTQNVLKSNTFSGGFGNNTISNNNNELIQNNSGTPVQNININIISHNYSNFYVGDKNDERQKINNYLKLENHSRIKERKNSNNLNTFDKSKYSTSSNTTSNNANFFNKSSSSINPNYVRPNHIPSPNISTSNVKKNPVNIYTSNSQHPYSSFINSQYQPNHSLSKTNISSNQTYERPASAVAISNQRNYLSASTSSPLSISSYSSSKPKVISIERGIKIDRDRQGNNINSLINSMNTPKRNLQKNSSNNSKTPYPTSSSSNYIQRKLSFSNLRSSYEEENRNKSHFNINSRSVDRTKLKSSSYVSNFNSNKFYAHSNYRNGK
jgi:hypothetical protein